MKNCYTLISFLSFMFMLSNIAAAQDVLHNNGSLITNLNAGANSNHVSMLQNNTLGMNTLGFNSSFNFGYAVADDFEVPDSVVWYIDEFTVYAYQTGSTTASTIVAAYVRIWSGTPGEPGSSIIFGDTTTNRLNSTQFSGIYRSHQNIGFGNTDRPIMSNKVDAGVLLGPGTYWLEYSLQTATNVSAWMPPVTILGQTTTGNGLHLTPDGYNPLIDGAGNPDVGTQTPQGVAFIVHGWEADELELDEIFTADASCFGATDGSVSVSTTGGLLPLTFLWSNGDTSAQLSGIGAGIYTVEITDNIGQVLTLEIEVGQADELEWELVELNDATCYGEHDGNVEIAVTGGTEPYTVQWDPNTNDQTGLTAVDLNAGNYFATITDDNGCELLIVVTVGEADPLTPLTIAGATQVDEGTEQSYSVADIEGWSYEWFVAGGNILEGQGTPAIAVMWGTPGDGSVGIIAENPSGCETISSTGITIQEVVSVNDLSKMVTINLNPNPAADFIQIELSKQDEYLIQLYDLAGRRVYSQSFQGESYRITLTDLSAGNYILKISNKEAKHQLTVITKH